MVIVVQINPFYLFTFQILVKYVVHVEKRGNKIQVGRWERNSTDGRIYTPGQKHS